MLGFRIYRIFQLLMAIAVLIGIFCGWRYLVNPAHFPIRVVKLQAPYVHIDRKQLQQSIVPFAKRGFFDLNEAQLKQALLTQLPWIATVELQRVWPDGIIIRIAEHRPVAHWGKNQLIDLEGKFFTVAEAASLPNLPYLQGPDIHRAQIWDLYMAMHALMQPLGLHILKLEMDNRQALSLVLSNGTQILLGRRESLPRLQRFVKVYHKIFIPTEAQAERIDLRYQNGISVKWRESDNIKSK